MCLLSRLSGGVYYCGWTMRWFLLIKFYFSGKWAENKLWVWRSEQTPVKSSSFVLKSKTTQIALSECFFDFLYDQGVHFSGWFGSDFFFVDGQVMVELCQRRYGQVLSSMMMGCLDEFGCIMTWCYSTNCNGPTLHKFGIWEGELCWNSAREIWNVTGAIPCCWFGRELQVF